jgi:hypothetical protein
MEIDMTNAFAAAFDAYAPVLAAEFVAYHTRVITRLIEAYEGDLRGLGNAGTGDGKAYRASREFIAYDGSMMSSKAVGVVANRLQIAGEEYAKSVVVEFISKLVKKLASVTEVEVLWAKGSGQFTITGKMGERNVTVHQDRVFKISSKGTPFHQWPARIYVDGKFTPETEFKKLAA